MNFLNLLEDEGIKKSIAEFEVYVRSRSKSFTNFPLRDGNRFAHAAAQYAAQHIGAGLSPLFLYGKIAGEIGHLLQAMANTMRQHQQVKVEHVHARFFVNRFLDCKTADALLFEDVQLLNVEEQHALYKVISGLFEAGKQIVITSDRSPKQLQEDFCFIDRLLSRFESGLIIELH